VSLTIEWSAYSIEDRAAIFVYIEADNPAAAIAIDERIERQVNRLQKFPMLGRLGRVTGTRELVIVRTPYIVAYRIAGRAVIVLRILHGAQQWPASV
jgi:toxin ParE1/3/4